MAPFESCSLHIFQDEDKQKDEKEKKELYLLHCDKLRNKVKGILTVYTIRIWRDRPGQTLQMQINLLLKESSFPVLAELMVDIQLTLVISNFTGPD